MTRTFLVRFNKFNTTLKWLVEDAATLESWPAESVRILTPSETNHDEARTLYSVRATGVLVWTGQRATIKESKER